MHRQFDWVDTIASKEDSYSKKLMAQLEILYARFPPGKKRGRSSYTENGPRANRWRSSHLGDPDEEDDRSCPGPVVDGDSSRGEGGAGQWTDIYA